MATFKLIQGDCMEVMRNAKPESVDSCVCDPPYGIEFMGKTWDAPTKMLGQATGVSGGFNRIPPGTHRPDMSKSDPHLFQQWCEAWALEAMKVLKPGGHLLAFGSPRMYHRLAAGIEDAGFEIRDCIMWMYGSGFPKSHNVGKGIDKLLGAERPVVGEQADGMGAWNDYRHGDGKYPLEQSVPVTGPGSDDAAKWHGWGTALKPAVEPIIVARKPLRITSDKGRQKKGTVAQNVLEHGAGAYNIDGCRVEVNDDAYAKNHSGDRGHGGTRESGDIGATDIRAGGGSAHAEGRWPANVIMDEEAGAMLDEQSGVTKSAGGKHSGRKGTRNDVGEFGYDRQEISRPTDTGGASRFFYCAKASKAERRAGLDEHATHPTSKPINLMRYLVRLVTQPGGVVLDPFMGSGSTGIAAMLEGMKFVGIEREEEYMAIAQARMAHWEAEADG